MEKKNSSFLSLQKIVKPKKQGWEEAASSLAGTTVLLEAASAALLEASEQAVAEAAAAAAEAVAEATKKASPSSRWPAALALGASRWSLVGLVGRAAAPEVSGGEREGLACWPLDCDAA